MNTLEHALAIAEEAHRGQTDKAGRPFIEHLRRVAGRVDTLDGKVVAYLHDLLEKGEDWSRPRLEREGFGPAVVSAVEAMTKREGEDYAAFVRRAATNPLARAVKRADFEDNLAQARETGAPTQKYEQGLEILRDEFGA